MRPLLPDHRRARGQRWSSMRLTGRAMSAAPVVRAGAVALAVCGLLVLLAWPLVADGSRLKGDSPTDAVLISQQAEALRQGHLPSHFMHSDLGIFYGVFTFYGGTLFAFAGAVALIVGPAMTAQAIVYVLALAAAYVGWFWLARMAGVRFWLAHVPALIYVTAPLVITNVDVRQDLAESVATGMIPLVLASGLSVLRADRLRAGPVAALAGSTILLGGSHNLTLLWTTTVLGLTALVIAAGVPEARRMVTRRSLLRVLAILVPAMAVNAWYLLPDLAYYSHTAIAQRIDEWRTAVLTPGPAVNTEHLFALDRHSPDDGSAFTVALPVLAMAWVLVAAVAVRRQWRRPWARVLAILSLISAVLLVVITHPRLLTVLPDPWVMLQFSYRLETFVLFGICGAVIAALVLIGHDHHRWLTALLLPIVAFSVLGALRQVRDVPRYPSDIAWSLDNMLTYSTGDYADVSLRQRPLGERTPIVVFRRPNVHRNRFEATVRARPRQIVYIDAMAIASMVDIQGARVVGRWAVPAAQSTWQLRWYLALQIDDDATPGKARITIREARTLPIVAGWTISLLGLLGLAASAVVIARASYRRRRGG